MGERPKHAKKDIEALMQEAEACGWVFTKGSKYFSGKCTCGLGHIKWVHLTPSGSRYLLNLRKWFERTCWKDER